MTDYDNTNRGGGWAARAVSGNLDIEGVKHYAAMISTNATAENAPQAMLFVHHRDHPTISVALFTPKREFENLLFNGTLALGPDRQYFVDVYRNTKAHERSPQVDFVIKAKEQQRQATPPPANDWGSPQGADPAVAAAAAYHAPAPNTNAEYEAAEAAGGDNIPFD